MNDTVPVKATQTAFRVVDTLVEVEGATLSELADSLDMPTSTTHDHVHTLVSLGLVVVDDGEYKIGTRFLEIGSKVRKQMNIYQVARPEVDALADETGEHASLMIEENGLGVLLYVSKGEDAVNLNAHAGLRLVLSATAPGKALLANLPRDRVSEIIDEHGLKQYTSNTITERDELIAELDCIQERGYAIDTSELVEGVRALSVPVCDRREVQGAITIGGPVNRMSGKWFEEELPDLLLRSSNVIELNLTHF